MGVGRLVLMGKEDGRRLEVPPSSGIRAKGMGLWGKSMLVQVVVKGGSLAYLGSLLP